jgi:hypothetical protein
MRKGGRRLLFPLFTILAMVWFKDHPVIRFEDAEASARTELIANLILGSIVAVFAVIAVTALARAAGWMKD